MPSPALSLYVTSTFPVSVHKTKPERNKTWATTQQPHAEKDTRNVISLILFRPAPPFLGFPFVILLTLTGEGALAAATPIPAIPLNKASCAGVHTFAAVPHATTAQAKEHRRQDGQSAAHFERKPRPSHGKVLHEAQEKQLQEHKKKKKTAGRSSVQKLTKVILEKVLCLFGEVCELDWHGDMLDLRCAAKHNRAIGKHQQLRLAGATAWGN